MVLAGTAHPAEALGATELTTWDTSSLAASGFVSGGIPGSWNCGLVASGPGGGFDDATACATGLNGSYGNNAEDLLGLPSFDISGAVRPILMFNSWWNFESGDVGSLQIFQDGAWVDTAPIYGYPGGGGDLSGAGGWERMWVDLSGLSNSDEVRLRFTSNVAVLSDGWYVDDFELWDGDIVAPRIGAITQLQDTDNLTNPYVVEADAEDDVGLTGVTLKYSVNGSASVSVPMGVTAPGHFVAEIPPQPHDSTVVYWVVASDLTNSTSAPEGAPAQFLVRLPAPLELSGPDGVHHAGSADLSWSAPESDLPVVAYRLYRGEELIDEVSDLFATVVLEGDGLDLYSVSALYELEPGVEEEGYRSEPLAIDSAPPRIVEVSPGSIFQGDHVYLTVLGREMIFVEGEVELDLGDGVLVENVEVENVDRLRASLEISESAAVGFREVTVESGGFEVALDGALEIVDGAERPKVELVEPPSARQGESFEITLELSGPIAGLPRIDLGEGVVVDRVEWPAADRVLASGVVAWDAPLGEREIFLDDGVRLVEGGSFTVLDQVIDPVSTCSTVGSAGSRGAGALGALAAFVLLRRRRSRSEIR